MKAKLRRAAMAGAGFLVLIGCNTPPPPPPVIALASTKTCVDAPELGNATPLAFDPGEAKKLDISIDENSACLRTADGMKSLYAVVDLPSPGQGYMLSVSSAPQGAGIFSPHVLLLDASGKILRSIAREDFIYRGASLTAIFRAHKDERYLVIASDPKSVGKEDERVTGRTSQTTGSNGTFFFTVYSGSESKSIQTFSHSGKVTLTAQAIPNK